MTSLRVILILFTTISFAPFSPAVAQPSTLHFQSVMRSGGLPVEGVGAVKFALVSNDGLTTDWSHDRSSSGGAEPAGALFTVSFLGDGSGRSNLQKPTCREEVSHE